MIEAAVKSGVIEKDSSEKPSTSKSADEEANESSDENEDDEDEEEVQSFKNEMNRNEKSNLFKEMLEMMKPGETVLKAIKRLGKTSTGQSVSLSASQRWAKKKNGQQQQISEEDKKALEKLTSLANKFIDMGFYDIYEETYEKIKLKSEPPAPVVSKEEEFDMFADEIDESKLNKPSTAAALTEAAQNDTEDKVVKWFYKLTNTEDAKVNGPYTSEQMLKMSENGTFPKDTGVWCRKADESAQNFYNSKRIDFDLYT